MRSAPWPSPLVILIFGFSMLWRLSFGNGRCASPQGWWRCCLPLRSTPRPSGKVLHTERSFFGVSRVTNDPAGRLRNLFHGGTNHGMQNLNPRASREPLAYYTASGPAGTILRALQAKTLYDSGGKTRKPNWAVVPAGDGQGSGGLAEVEGDEQAGHVGYRELAGRRRWGGGGGWARRGAAGQRESEPLGLSSPKRGGHRLERGLEEGGGGEGARLERERAGHLRLRIAFGGQGGIPGRRPHRDRVSNLLDLILLPAGEAVSGRESLCRGELVGLQHPEGDVETGEAFDESEPVFGRNGRKRIRIGAASPWP